MKEEPPSRNSNSAEKTSWFSRLFKPKSPNNIDGILKLLGHAKTQGLFDQHAYNMIEGVFEVAEMRVRDIMVARSQMTVIEKELNFDDILNIVVQSGHSRFPVVGDDKDELIGILLAKDLLRHTGSANEFQLENELREVVIVPESKRLNTLLNCLLYTSDAADD